MRFLLFLPGLLFLVVSWLSAINEASRSSRKPSGRKSSACPAKPKPAGTAAIKPIVIRDEPPKRPRGRPRKNPAAAPVSQQPKRGPGRPRKYPVEATAAQKGSSHPKAPSAKASTAQSVPSTATAENHSSALAVQLAFPGFSLPENAAPIQQIPDDEEPEFRFTIGQLGIPEIIY